ncbi:MAG: radical SAM protein [Anaerolineae bacterium]|nr:radical SAM protein [Anaerolineae bacterium]
MEASLGQGSGQVRGDVAEPGYVTLYRAGELQRRASVAWAMLARCELCPHRCGVNRLAGERGICGMGDQPKVSSWNLHAWEEPPISGSRGSGTIFFSGCTGRCRFCQNYPISQLGYGDVVSVARLAGMMLELQRRGAHNINLVTPTHFMPAILSALPHAVRQGLRLPLVYNTSGYERVEMLRLLEGVVEVWLPDAKYASDETARRLSGFGDYVRHNRAALHEMYRQVGSALVLDDQGLAWRGLIVRHMVLPDGLAGSAAVLSWIARELSAQIHVSLMDQYFPAHRAVADPILGRKVTPEEYQAALEAFDASGLEFGWCQQTACDEEGSC